MRLNVHAGKVPSDLLVFELNLENDELFLHGDPAGLRRLAALLTKLADVAEGGKFPHEHLFTPAWGGGELSSQPQEKGHHSVNHVKIYGWPNTAGAMPYNRSDDSAADL